MSNFFFKTVLVSFILIIITSIFIPVFFSAPITLSDEYYSQYDIDSSYISLSSFRILLAITL